MRFRRRKPHSLIIEKEFTTDLALFTPRQPSDSARFVVGLVGSPCAHCDDLVARVSIMTRYGWESGWVNAYGSADCSGGGNEDSVHVGLLSGDA